jgi:glycerol-3-phosphate dehydrogenase (NAD(P)+)
MPDNETLSVIGAGAWGSALTIHLARQGQRPRLWVYEAPLVTLITEKRENPWYLPGCLFPQSVSVTGTLSDAVRGSSLVIVAVPSHAFRHILQQMIPSLQRGATLLIATKGIEETPPHRMSAILSEMLPTEIGAEVAVLSGPTFAKEVAEGQPTAAVLASSNLSLAENLQRRLSAPHFRLYTNRDVIGVEIGGAVKNVMAIATGISDGLGLGENARAALITRGLAEITRLGVRLGASPLTFSGLAGVGDLVLTCAGSLSRNRRLGLELASGKRVEEVLGETRSVVEGVRTTKSTLALAERYQIPMPITEAVGEVLFHGLTPRAALSSLLHRDYRPEDEPVASTPTKE